MMAGLSEEEKHFERNRVAFEGWLERKNEERRKERERESREAEMKLVGVEEKQVASRRAYEGWLRRKREEDELVRRQKAIERQLRDVEMVRKREGQRRAEESFQRWKLQKDVEFKPCKMKQETKPVRELTPSLSGYCSVWSCDTQLAGFMIDKLPRGEQALSNYTMPSDSPEVQQHLI